MAVITSRSNPKIKLVRSLRQKKARQETGLFIVEGIRHIGEAFAADWQFEQVLYAPGSLKSEFAQKTLAQLAEKGIACEEVNEDVFESLAEKENPQGILAVVHKKETRLENINPANCPWAVALVEPQDAGNIGAILRTMDAVGAGALFLLDGGVDPYHPTAVRAGMGALFWLPVISLSFTDFVTWSKANHYTVYGTSAHASRDAHTIQAYQRPCILLMGSEREGLSPEQAAGCHEMLCLPMKGRVTSLNLAVATGIFLYDIFAKENAQ